MSEAIVEADSHETQETEEVIPHEGDKDSPQDEDNIFAQQDEKDSAEKTEVEPEIKGLGEEIIEQEENNEVPEDKTKLDFGTEEGLGGEETPKPPTEPTDIEGTEAANATQEELKEVTSKVPEDDKVAQPTETEELLKLLTEVEEFALETLVPKEKEEEIQEVTEAQAGEQIVGEDELKKAVEEEEIELEIEEHRAEIQAEISHLSLRDDDEPPVIRGLAELEYESEESLEDMFDEEVSSWKRKSAPTKAITTFKTGEEESMEKRKYVRPKKDVLARVLRKAVPVKKEDVKLVKEKEPPPTREELYVLHEQLTSEIALVRMKNKFLQRKVAEHFKKRKMEHVLKEETETRPETILKYERKLNRLADILELYKRETTRINGELDVLQRKKDGKNLERTNTFNKWINRQKEIGIGLISTKTGKEIPDKVVEHLIRREVNAAKQISELRLKYISKRDEVSEKTTALRALDNIGENLSLMDYEQLKIENRAHSDKLEEREEELTKLRIKCRNAVQIMAHVREKSAALDADIDELREDYEDIHYEYIEVRERLNYCKTERDAIRNKTMKLKAESGLLTKPKLLFDMEMSLEEAKLYEQTLEKVKAEYNLKTQQIRNLRKNIAYEILVNKKTHKEKKKKPEEKFFQVRPTLINPKLPKNVFHKLETAIFEQEMKKHEKFQQK